MSNKIIFAQGLSDKILPRVEGTQGDLPDLIVNLLNTMVGAAAVICVVVMIFAGYMYITASGDETKIEKATKTLTYAIVGLAICFIAVLLVNFVLKEILGIDAPVGS